MSSFRIPDVTSISQTLIQNPFRLGMANSRRVELSSTVTRPSKEKGPRFDNLGPFQCVDFLRSDYSPASSSGSTTSVVAAVGVQTDAPIDAAE